MQRPVHPSYGRVKQNMGVYLSDPSYGRVKQNMGVYLSGRFFLNF